MSVAYILNQAGSKMGLNPSDTNERATLLRFLNEAAVELYVQSDMAGSLMEQVFQVNGDNTIALPSYVGQLRAVRELNSQIAWHINQMRPRYNVVNWKDMWRNWRIKGQQALMRPITNESKLVISVPAVETPPITVSVSGPTATAALISETVTISSLVVQTVNNYIDATTLTKNVVNNYDVTVKDVDGNTLAVIPNNTLESSYLIVDVSTLPWSSQPTDPLSHYVEVLYKKALPWFKNDSDEFPARGYDNIIVNKMMQLWGEEKGDVKKAELYDAKATRSLARRHEEENRATEDMVGFVPNAHDSLLDRLRSNRPGRASIYPVQSYYTI